MVDTARRQRRQGHAWPRSASRSHMADQFGVIEVDPNDPQKIAAFVEKPSSTPGLAADPTQFLASMGNYVFDADALVEALHVDAERLDTKHDMGGDIIPYFVNQGEAGVYDFTLNDIPGSTERDRTYWRDVGTIDSFYDAHMDLISPRAGVQPVQLRMADLHPPEHLPAGQVRPRQGQHRGHGAGFHRGQRRGHFRRHRGGLRAVQRRLRRHVQPGASTRC